MASKSPIAILFACLATLLVLAQAQPRAQLIFVTPEASPHRFSGRKWLGVQQCWASFFNIGGCIGEIYRSFNRQSSDQGGQMALIGPMCCHALSEINDKCWPKNPFYPPLVKGYCASYGGDGRGPIAPGPAVADFI